jgi:hypothetical protein
MTKLRFRIVRLLLTLGGAAASCWACIAPFSPLPPPGQTAAFTSELVADGDGGTKTVWVAHGAANSVPAFAQVLVFDTNRSAGVIAGAAADGSYISPPLDGTRGDRVEISFENVQGEISRSTCFQLIESATAPGCQPP